MKAPDMIEVGVKVRREPLMKTVEVAAALGVSPRFVLTQSDESLGDARLIERVTLGAKTIRFRREDVEALIAKGGAQS
jgi:hypothetical protein